MNDVELTTMMNGRVDYVLNKANIGTINDGSIGEVCDASEIETMNNGKVCYMRGKEIVCQQIAGEIENQSSTTLVLYSQKKELVKNILKPQEDKKRKKKEPVKETELEKTEESQQKNDSVQAQLDVDSLLEQKQEENKD